jgi:hypothetical protein
MISGPGGDGRVVRTSITVNEKVTSIAPTMAATINAMNGHFRRD